MWIVENIEVIPVKLDFSRSGQKRFEATAIVSSGVRLFNAIELVDMEQYTTQVEVCECCGFSHCSSGGWVTFRRIGEKVVWIPSWDEMEKGAWEMSEYRPPKFLHRKGVPVFSSECWESLGTINNGLPVVHELPFINSREAIRLCQWSAPGRILSMYPSEPRLRHEILIAVTDGDLTDESDLVEKYVIDHYKNVHPMELVPDRLDVAPIEFWLDLPGIPGWKSFAHVQDQICVLLDGIIALLQEGGLTTGCSCRGTRDGCF